MKNVKIYNKNQLGKKLIRYVIVGTSVLAVVGTVTKCAKKSNVDVFLDNYENNMTKIKVESFIEEEKGIRDYYETYATGYLTPERFEKAFKDENGTDEVEIGDTAIIPVLLDSDEIVDLAEYLSRGQNVQYDANPQNFDNFIMEESDYKNFENFESYKKVPITINYTVQGGEWLEKIAAKFKTSIYKITYADGTKILNKDFIKDGEVLKIETYQYVLDEMENKMNRTRAR